MLRLSEAEYDELTGRPPLDPDPLTFGQQDPYEQADRDDEWVIRVIALAAFTGLLLGIVIAVSASGALR